MTGPRAARRAFTRAEAAIHACTVALRGGAKFTQGLVYLRRARGELLIAEQASGGDPAYVRVRQNVEQQIAHYEGLEQQS